MDFQEDSPKRRGGDAAVVYMVSIYLLLIAFFVILHTISKKEAVREAAVVGSLRVTFQRPEDRTEDLPSASGRTELSGPNEVFRDQLESVFGSFLDTARFSQVKKGNVLQVTVAAKDLFYDRTATLRADRIDLMRRMADLVTNPQPYRRNTIEIGFEAAVPLDGNDGLGRRLEIRRGGVLARDLVRNEVDPALVTVGIFRGAPDTLRITFTSRSSGSGPQKGSK